MGFQDRSWPAHTVLTTADLLRFLPVERFDGEGGAGGGHGPEGAVRFRGTTCSMPRADWAFGGLTAAQALVASGTTAPGMVPRSVSTRFVRRGTPGEPIEHEVEVVGDSRTFADRLVRSRHVGGEVLALTTVLAHVPDDTDLAHHRPPAGEVPPPDGGEVVQGAGFELVDLNDPPTHARAAAPAEQRHWMRAPGTPPGDPWTNAAMLLMASDLHFVGTAWRPIEGASITEVGRVVSFGLQLTMWFHGPADAAEWHLLDAVSPAAAAGRSLSIGHWHAVGGELVATVALDAVMRLR